MGPSALGIKMRVCGYDEDVAPSNLAWQSKLVLLLVLPWTAVSVVIHGAIGVPAEPAVRDAGSGVERRPGTAGVASAHGHSRRGSDRRHDQRQPDVLDGVIRLCKPWNTGMVPVLVVLILTSLATRFGRRTQRAAGHRRKAQGPRRRAGGCEPGHGGADHGPARAECPDRFALACRHARLRHCSRWDWRLWPKPPPIQFPPKSARCSAALRA